MSEEKPETIGELIDHLKQFDPKTELVTRDPNDILSFRLCRWKPIVTKMVPDPSLEGAFTFYVTGHNSKEIVHLLVIG